MAQILTVQQRLPVLLGFKMWLWLKKRVPNWNPDKWKHGPKPA